MVQEASGVVERIAAKVNAINLDDMLDHDTTEYVAKYHIICAWMVGIEKPP